MSTLHIEAKKEDIAPLVIMPGDPNRAKFIADKYLVNAKVVNEVRGMLAFTGFYKKIKVTVMASGMGIPSMGIYSHELYDEYDVQAIIRIGTAGSKSKRNSLGDLILTKSAYSDSSYDDVVLGYDKQSVDADSFLNKVILSTANTLDMSIKEEVVRTTEGFYEVKEESTLKVVEMEAFALFINALKFKRKAACILTISDIIGSKEKISREDREKNLDSMIKLALESITLIK